MSGSRLAFLRLPVQARAWRETLHLLLDLPVGIAGFTVVAVGLATGISAAASLIGIPIVAATLLVGRVLGGAERARARALLGLEVAEPAKPPPAEGWRRLLAIFQDGAAWRALVYLAALLPLGILNFTLAVTVWSAGLGLLTLPAWAWSVPGGGIQINSHRYSHTPAELAAAAAVGFLVVLAAPWVVRGLASLDRRLVLLLLGPTRASRESLERRVDELRSTRERSVEVGLEERRRIERDLHDGAQARLVALGLDLGLALEKLDSDPGEARELVQSAHGEARHALVELRDLARGIHPAVLTNGGLDAALSSIASRSPIPVRLHVELARRPPASVEATAYFIVSEAVANAAKHSGAGEIDVTVAGGADRLLLSVRDDGRGGADPAGTGLAGLAGRAAALDGVLSVESPPGGPTTIRAELPCAS